MNIKIKYFTDKIEKLRYIDGKSDWIDLRAAEDVTLKKGEWKLIPLGVAMQLPEGYEAHIVPRSSTYKNFGIIQINDRICQFRIMENQPKIEFEEADHLEGKDRGGFGSTGKN